MARMDPPLGIALIVALVAFTGTVVVAIAQARGMKDARFAEQKRLLYTEFLLAADAHVQAVIAQIESVGSQLRLTGRIDEIPPYGTTEAVERAYRGLMFVAPSPVVMAAAATGDALIEIDEYGIVSDMERPRPKPEEWEAAGTAYSDARAVFIDAARKDLGQRGLPDTPDA